MESDEQTWFTELAARGGAAAGNAAVAGGAAALPRLRGGRAAEALAEAQAALPHLRPAPGPRRARLLPRLHDVQLRPRRGAARARGGGGDDRHLAARAVDAAGDRRAGDDGRRPLRLLPLLADHVARLRPPPP